MNFVIDPFIKNQEYLPFIRFLETKQNIIMQGEFTKTIYSDDLVTINGIYLNCPLDTNQMDYNKGYPKNMLWFHPYNPLNYRIIQYFETLEQNLIDTYLYYSQSPDSMNKTRVTLLKNQLLSGNTKIYRDTPYLENSRPYPNISMNHHHSNKSITSNYIIKISGIWETTDSIGITYKFLEMFT